MAESWEENSWKDVIYEMLVEVKEEGRWYGLEFMVAAVVWGALRATMIHPEWAQANMLTMPNSEIVDRLAAILVNGTPVERMAV